MEHNSEVADFTARRLIHVLAEFKITGEIAAIHKGPTVTLYEVQVASGVRVGKIAALAPDIARCMTSKSARVSNIPGSTAVGIELPNAVRDVVLFTDLVTSDEWLTSTADVPIILGTSMTGKPVIVDLTKMPHLLIAGTTGSGKSIGIHAIISSILTKFSSDECRLILIDPKMLEMTQYSGIPHLLTPVVVEPEKAIVALKWTLIEMERRYRLMSQLNLRNITHFNKFVNDTKQAAFSQENMRYDEDGELEYSYLDMPLQPMPFIVVVIDEVADLILVAGKEVEATMQRLAQMARAAGIHLIMATQRPSVDIITGSIKANFPTRISFQVQSKIDSRTILGQPGAEQLIGSGDMLLLEGASTTRIQGAYISSEEVEALTSSQRREQGNACIDEIITKTYG